MVDETFDHGELVGLVFHVHRKRVVVQNDDRGGTQIPCVGLSRGNTERDVHQLDEGGVTRVNRNMATRYGGARGTGVKEIQGRVSEVLGSSECGNNQRANTSASQSDACGCAVRNRLSLSFAPLSLLSLLSSRGYCSCNCT